MATYKDYLKAAADAYYNNDKDAYADVLLGYGGYPSDFIKDRSSFDSINTRYKTIQHADLDEVNRDMRFVNDVQKYIRDNPTTEFLIRQQIADKQNSSLPTFQGGKWTDTYNRLADLAMNRETYKYDPNADPTAQAIRREYIQGGKMAARDTLASASAATGGMSSSFAQQAAQQAYGNYMKDYATNVIPALEQAAIARAEAETQDVLTKLGIAEGMANSEYNRWATEEQQKAAKETEDFNLKLQLAGIAESKLQAEREAETAQMDSYKEQEAEIKANFKNYYEQVKDRNDLTTTDFYEYILDLTAEYGLSLDEISRLFTGVAIPGGFEKYKEWLKKWYGSHDLLKE